jgi:hypothetical protein
MSTNLNQSHRHRRSSRCDCCYRWSPALPGRSCRRRNCSRIHLCRQSRCYSLAGSPPHWHCRSLTGRRYCLNRRRNYNRQRTQGPPQADYHSLAPPPQEPPATALEQRAGQAAGRQGRAAQRLGGPDRAGKLQRGPGLRVGMPRAGRGHYSGEWGALAGILNRQSN